MTTVDISGLDPAAVLAALYNATRPHGMGHLAPRSHEVMTRDQAADVIARYGHAGATVISLDWVRGRPLKIELPLCGGGLDVWLFDRDAGDGAAARAIAALRAQAGGQDE